MVTPTSLTCLGGRGGDRYEVKYDQMLHQFTEANSPRHAGTQGLEV